MVINLKLQNRDVKLSHMQLLGSVLRYRNNLTYRRNTYSPICLFVLHGPLCSLRSDLNLYILSTSSSIPYILTIPHVKYHLVVLDKNHVKNRHGQTDRKLIFWAHSVSINSQLFKIVIVFPIKLTIKNHHVKYTQIQLLSSAKR